MSTDTIEYTGVLAVIKCGACHIRFAIPDDMLRRVKERGDWFWCPSGCKICYSKTEIGRLRDQLDWEKRRNGWMSHSLDQAEAEAKHQAAKARGFKGALVKQKKRIGNGVCPCCQRHFTNVERHMKSQHPDFAGTEKESRNA